MMAAPSRTECNQTPNASGSILSSQCMGDNVRTREENNPDRQSRSPAKVPKYMLSGKGCGVVKTARRLAQKQPSFKECVIAH